MRTIKQMLCQSLQDIKDDNKLTYKQIVSLVESNEFLDKITEAQIAKILNKDGHGVSEDVVHRIIKSLGYSVCFFLEEDMGSVKGLENEKL